MPRNRPGRKSQADWIDRLSRLTQLFAYALYWSIVIGVMFVAGACLSPDPHKGPVIQRANQALASPYSLQTAQFLAELV
jgi:hypothetical protein